MKPDLSIIREREKVEKTKRSAPSLTTQVAVLQLQAVCFMCREPFDGKRIEYDHLIPLALGGLDEPCNIRALCCACHRLKTASDIAIIARAKRRAGETGQLAMREKTGPKIRSGKKIASRGFPSKQERARAKALKKEQERR